MSHPSFELTLNPEQLFAWAHLPSEPRAEKNYSGTAFSHRRYPILRLNSEGQRELVWMRQGLIPAYAHDEEGAEDREEAHTESLTCTSCYRSAFRRRRCIIPADQVTDLQHGPAKVAALCSLLLRSGAIFGLGGVWETWENDNGHSVQTFAVVTTPAPTPLQQLADRVPVVIPDMNQDRWLQAGDVQHPPLDLLRPLSADDLQDWQVKTCSPAGVNGVPPADASS